MQISLQFDEFPIPFPVCSPLFQKYSCVTPSQRSTFNGLNGLGNKYFICWLIFFTKYFEILTLREFPFKTRWDTLYGRVVAFQKVFEFEFSIFSSRPKVTMTTGQTTSELMWKDGWTSSSRRWKISGKTSAKSRIMWRKLNANTVLFYPHHKRMKVRLSLCTVSQGRQAARDHESWAAEVKARKWKPLFAATSAAVPQEV